MKVFITGTGNVATSLGTSILKAGHTISGVYGRDSKKADKLAKKFRCTAFYSLKEIPKNSDFYIVAIKDDSIASVIREFPKVKGIVAHTSGATPMNILRKFANRGVFYPVETITKNHPRTFKKIPVCIESSNENSMKILMLLASSISGEIYHLSTRQRTILHVAAVFTNNFTNALIGIATDLLSQQHLPPALLEPLARSTINNAFVMGSLAAQTGPAARNDIKIIKAHLKLLEKNKNYQKIYQTITDQIRIVHNKKQQ